MPRITIEPHAAPADVAIVHDGLRAFNVAHIGDPGLIEVNVFLRDDDGTVVGGLTGHIKWRWLYVAKLWIDDRHRTEGGGSQLMAAAERFAVENGCIGSFLDTFSYQARPFYEKLGYSCFGTLEGFPPGHAQHFLSKHLHAPFPHTSPP
jgi:GNAT superfamily N-acetyltransferase